MKKHERPEGPKPAPDVPPAGEPAEFDPFDPQQVAAAPQLAGILVESVADRPTITEKFPVTNFTLHPNGCLGTFPFVAIPEQDDYSYHLIDARLAEELAARGAVIKMKRLYRGMVWNPDIEQAEVVVVRSAPATSRDHTAAWFVGQERVVRRAEGGWVNVSWNQRNKKFRIAAIKNGPEPSWREVSARDFVAEAFEGQMISGLDDPLLSFLANYSEVDPE
jgi:hypothetical protein